MGFVKRQEAEEYSAQVEQNTLKRVQQWRSQQAAVLLKEDAFHCNLLVWEEDGRSGSWERPDKGDTWCHKTLCVKQVPEGKSQEGGLAIGLAIRAACMAGLRSGHCQCSRASLQC